jgi:hypothetical protein
MLVVHPRILRLPEPAWAGCEDPGWPLVEVAGVFACPRGFYSSRTIFCTFWGGLCAFARVYKFGANL